jgi:hypothetical protein
MAFLGIYLVAITANAGFKRASWGIRMDPLTIVN